jgi:phosphoribosyl 1,2-cyclic phosphodiesterase
VDCADLDGIVITHEHSDHVGGLRALLRSACCPVFVSQVITGQGPVV